MAGNNRIDEEILKLGEEIQSRISNEVPGVFNKEYWHARILEWAMKDPGFKVDLLRFVDILPALRTTGEVSQHVREYLLKEGRELPGLISAAFKTASGGVLSFFGTRALRKNVTMMARQFIAGEEAKAALPVLRELHKNGIAFTADLLGEATLGDREARAYTERYLDLIDNLSEEAVRWGSDEVIDNDHRGPIPRTNVSLKISAMDAGLDAVDPAGGVERLKKMVLPLFLRAKERNVFINVDLEQWELHGITYDLFEEILGDPQIRNWPHVGIVVQAYSPHASKDIDRLISLARSRSAPITVRLVKGAYWDYEVINSRKNGYPCPVFTDKAETDENYERLSETLLKNIDHLIPAFGSHNLRSVAHALTIARELGLPDNSYEIQMLYGMAEPERRALRSMGRRVRLYVPIGEMLPGMGYLVRRLLENSSNTGFLRQSYRDGVDIRSLLQRPKPEEKKMPPGRMRQGDISTPFENCPLSDFTDNGVRETFAKKVVEIKAGFPVKIPKVIAGKENFSGPTLERYCPSNTDIHVSTVSLADKRDADRAVETAMRAFPSWRDLKIEERATILERFGNLLEAERLDIAALQTYEVGKPWREADGDVAEAIDFCRYYARQGVIELGPRKQGETPGEENILYHQGRGPVVVIAPWNFPAAILCGMTTAALVAGNTVIMKPAGPSCAVAYALYERMMTAGFPPDVVQFLPGAGEEVGNHLVEHPMVAQIAFTGSMQVGLSVIEKAEKTGRGQPQVKRVVCEMGGKNAVIVDSGADLDEAVSGVMQSAFGYAGQKCSACSRVIIVDSVYESFVKRLIDACRSIIIAPAHLPSCRLGPVVNEEAYKRLMEVIINPGDGAKPLFVGDAPKGGYYVPPALFEVNDYSHPLMQKELFGPILAVMKVKDFSKALEVANSTKFALTGGLYSRTPSHQEEARKHFQVGNLYFNRNITGALVNRQPFGGFGMSGIGTKAGGPGYLLHFADPRCVTENRMRRGFSPDVGM